MDPALLATPPAGMPVTDPAEGPSPAHRRFATALELAGTLQSQDVESKALRAATDLLTVDTVSLWFPHGDGIVCPVAVGEHASALVGARVKVDGLDGVLAAEDGMAVMQASLASAGGVAGSLRVGRAPTTGGQFTAVERGLLEVRNSANG